jgi:NADH:ubiquinone oxidoreductase subunit 3 (subunit A)
MNITLIVLIVFVPILALILLALNSLLAPHKAYEDKLSQFECGMPVLAGQTRESFQIHFWLVAMLFLVFDIELVLLLPVSVTLQSISIFGYSIAVIFFLILTVGFILEISSGSVTIKSTQTQNNNFNPHINKVFKNKRISNKVFKSNKLQNKFLIQNYFNNFSPFKYNKFYSLDSWGCLGRRYFFNSNLNSVNNIHNNNNKKNNYSNNKNNCVKSNFKNTIFNTNTLKLKISKFIEKINKFGIEAITLIDLEIFDIIIETKDHIVCVFHFKYWNYWIELSILKPNQQLWPNLISYNINLYKIKDIIINKKNDILCQNAIWVEEISSEFIDIFNQLINKDSNNQMKKIKEDIQNSSNVNNNTNAETYNQFSNILPVINNKIDNSSANNNLNCSTKSKGEFKKIAKDSKGQLISFNFKDLSGWAKSFNGVCKGKDNILFTYKRYLIKHVNNQISVFKKIKFIVDNDNNIIKSKIVKYKNNLNCQNNKILNWKYINKIPDIFWKKIVLNDLNTQENLDTKKKYAFLDSYFNNKISSTFLLVNILDKFNKKALIILHFNHCKGIIDRYNNINNKILCQHQFIRHNKRINLNLTMYSRINLFITDILFIKFKNVFDLFYIRSNGKITGNNKFIKVNRKFSHKINFVNRIITKNNTNSINNNQIFLKLQNKKINICNMQDYLNVDIKFIDVNDINSSPFIKDFLAIYNDKKNSNHNIEEIIKNFKKLVNSKIKAKIKAIDKNDLEE